MDYLIVLAAIFALNGLLVGARPLTDSISTEDHELIRKQKEKDCAEALLGQQLEPAMALEVIQNAGDFLSGRLAGNRQSPRIDPRSTALIRMMTGVQMNEPLTTTTMSPLKRRYPTKDDIFTPELPKKRCRIRSDETEFSPETARNILAMKLRNATEKTIQKKYKNYARKKLPMIRKIAKEETTASLEQQIEEHVMEQMARYRRPGNAIVRGWMLRTWAAEKARAIGHNSFSASVGWLYNIKKRNRIVSRKITERVSRARLRNQEAIDANVIATRVEFTGIRHMYRDRLILNFDQSQFNYEFMSERTLSFEGERDTLVQIDQANKVTHSYTVMPLVTRDGRAVGKLLIVLQEPGGRLGPRVRPQVEDMERRLGNIFVQASSSGKMSTDLMLDWAENVLFPYIDELEPMRIDDDLHMNNNTAPRNRSSTNNINASAGGQDLHNLRLRTNGVRPIDVEEANANQEGELSAVVDFSLCSSESLLLNSPSSESKISITSGIFSQSSASSSTIRVSLLRYGLMLQH
jgi:hypothetical protein